MKKHLIAISFILWIQLIYGQQWYSSKVPYYRDVNSVTILKPNVVILAGGNAYNDSIQALYRTDDAGLTWNENPTDYISSWIKSIAFKDTLHGFGVGYNAKMVYTSDGGYNWLIGSSPLTRHLNKVIYLNANSLITVGGEPDPTNSLQTIMKSFDGGSTWTVLYDQPGQWLRSVYFKDTLNGFAVGDSGVFLQTNNGGSLWNAVSSPLLRGWNDITFTSALTGFVVGGNDTLATILKTTDGGANWTILADGAGTRLRSISFLNQNSGKIVGDASTLLATTDGGQSWQPEIVPNTLGANFTSVDFYSDSFGVIGAVGGTEFIYTKSHIPDAYTTGVFYTDSTSAELTGLINTHGYPGQYYFICDTDITFLTAFVSSTGIVASNSLTQVSENIYNLSPHTKYYYLMVASTLAGTVYADTLSFNIDNTNLFFSTTGDLVINDTTVQLMGLINGVTYPLNVSFEYGNTPNFGDSIVGIPSIIVDTASHNITATITHIQPLRPYYYRLRGISGGVVLLGNTLSFYTGTIYSSLQTQQAQNVTDTTAILNGSISGAGLPVALTFEFSADTPAFNQSIPANPSNVSDTLAHYISANVNALQPFHTYYYRLAATNSIGTFYSNITSFYTGFDLALQVLPASAISTDSALLSGYINADTIATRVWFEYGLNNVFSDSIAATPSVVTGTQQFLVTAQLSGLIPYQQYVYRMMAQNAHGIFYSTPMNFCTCPNEIPNWDFELWDHYTVNYPIDWLVLGTVSEAPSYDGSKAALIQGNLNFPGGAVAQGNPEGSNDIVLGFPFTARPDSFIFYANYNVQPGDSAIQFVGLKRNGQTVGLTYNYITGNSSNSFKRFSFPLTYSSSAIPDSVAVGFLSTNVFGQPNRLSWLMVDNVSFSGTTQNIPNPGFEEWDSLQYDTPERWIYKNDAPLNIHSAYPIEKTTDAHSGHYAVRLQNILSSPKTESGAMYVVSRNLQNGLIPGCTISERYRNLFGFAKFFPQNNDTALVEITLYKNGQSIGQGQWEVDSTISEYARFTVPIMYYDSISIPDSATIDASASYTQVHGLSVLYIDDLGFDGLWMDSITTDIPVITSNNTSSVNLRVYPNPANDVLFIKNMGDAVGEAEIEIYNMLGQLVSGTERVWIGNNSPAQINIQNLEIGSYILTVSLNGQRSNSLFIK